MIRAIEVVVRDPEPVVFEVDGCGFRDVEEEEGAFAGRVSGMCRIGLFGAGVGLEICARGAADAEVDVPHSRSALLLGRVGDVPFYEDGAWLGAFGLEDEVAEFDGAGVAWLADLEDGGGVGLGGEGGAGGYDHGPNFAGDFDVFGDFDCGGDDVGAVVEVYDLVGGSLVENCLDGCGIIGGTVAFGAVGLDAEKRGGWNRLVLGLGTLEYGTLGVQERSRLARRCQSALDRGA